MPLDSLLNGGGAGDLLVMDQALLEMERLTLSTPEGMAADGRFHQAVLHASQNDALIALGAGIAAAVERSTRFKQRNRTLPRDPIPEHREVYDAIASSDGARARLSMKVLVDPALDDTWMGMNSIDV